MLRKDEDVFTELDRLEEEEKANTSSAWQNDEDVFAQLDRLEEEEKAANLQRELNLLVTPAPPANIRTFVIHSPVMPPPVKRKANDSFTPIAFFTPKNKKGVAAKRTACPLLYETVMKKIVSDVDKGTTLNPFFDDVEKTWLNGETIKFKDESCQITKEELKNIFMAMLEHKRIGYVNELWEGNSLLLKEIIASMDQDSLYDIFEYVIQVSVRPTLKQCIWENCSDRILKNDVIQLQELFLAVLKFRAPVINILKSLWKNKPVRNALLSANDETTTKILLDNLMILKMDMLVLLLSPERALYNLIRNMAEVDAANLIYDYGVFGSITEEKLRLVVSVIDQSSVLEKVLEKIKSSKKELRYYFSPVVEERMRAIKKSARSLYAT